MYSTLTSATFADTSNWSVNGSSIDVTNPTTNAGNLTSNYSTREWTKS